MLNFNAGGPFPLMSPEEHTYREAQSHAEQVDRWLGLDVAEVEARLQTHGCRAGAAGSGDRQELWIGLDRRSLLTPYTELRYMLSKLPVQPGDTVVDLGAAYGRMGFVLHRHHPGVAFVGYEYVGERVEAGRKILAGLKDPGLRLEHVDLSDPEFVPDVASYYFIYDFGNYKAVEKVLYDLKKIAARRAIVVIGRGRLCRDLIERLHPWLSQVVRAEHHGHFSIYRSDGRSSDGSLSLPTTQ